MFSAYEANQVMHGERYFAPFTTEVVEILNQVLPYIKEAAKNHSSIFNTNALPPDLKGVWILHEQSDPPAVWDMCIDALEMLGYGVTVELIDDPYMATIISW